MVYTGEYMEVALNMVLEEIAVTTNSANARTTSTGNLIIQEIGSLRSEIQNMHGITGGTRRVEQVSGGAEEAGDVTTSGSLRSESNLEARMGSIEEKLDLLMAALNGKV